MRNYNTMSRLEYVLTNIFWMLIMLLWYRNWLFIPIQGYTAELSKGILRVFSWSFLLFGMIVTYRRRRNYLSIIVNSLLPLQMYTLASYAAYLKMRMIITVSIAGVIIAVFTGMVMICAAGEKRSHRQILKRRFVHAFLGSRTILTFCLCFFMVPIAIGKLTGSNLYQSSIASPKAQEEDARWTMDNQMDTLTKLKPEIWNVLTVQERLDVLGVLKNIEICYLGISHEIDLAADVLDEEVWGCYIENEHKIILDLAHLKEDGVKAVIHTLLHECHHAYSHQQVAMYQSLPDEYKNMPMFYTVQQYAFEYSNYVDGKEDYTEYALQHCERMANAYAEEGVEHYLKAAERGQRSR